MSITSLPPEIERLQTLCALWKQKRGFVTIVPWDDVPPDLCLALKPAISAWPMDDRDRESCADLLWDGVLGAAIVKAAELALPAARDLAAKGPSADDLYASPILSEWTPVRLTSVEGMYIIGINRGSPGRTERVIYTPRLCGLDAGLAWARTVRKWYRLGTLVSLTELSEIRSPSVNVRGAEVVTLDAVREWLEAERIGRL